MAISTIVSKAMTIDSTIVVGLSLSLGFPLSIDISVAISSIVSKSMAIESTIVVGLSLSLGFPLAIDISVAISSIRRISIPYSTIVEGVSLSLSLGVSNGAGRQGEENQHLHIGSC